MSKQEEISVGDFPADGSGGRLRSITNILPYETLATDRERKDDMKLIVRGKSDHTGLVLCLVAGYRFRCLSINSFVTLHPRDFIIPYFEMLCNPGSSSASESNCH